MKRYDVSKLNSPPEAYGKKPDVIMFMGGVILGLIVGVCIVVGIWLWL